MKLRILNLGIPATHHLITTINNLSVPDSISDFDAFVLDPDQVVLGTNAHLLDRRRLEIQDLALKKGGVVVCLLRPLSHFNFAWGGHSADPYDLFAPVDARVARIRHVLRAGTGSSINLVPNAKGVSAVYFRVLSGVLRFTAYLDILPVDFEGIIEGTVLAVDSVQHPIAFELPIGAGRLCVLPIPNGATGDRIGSAIVRIVEAHYGGPSEITTPTWLTGIGVPGANIHDAAISKLENEKDRIETEVQLLKQKRLEILSHRVLLYGYGKSFLEPVVRSALRVLGFNVPEPEEYDGEWDFELYTGGSSERLAIGEIEGSEGVIDVDKFRQLLNYVQDEALEGRDYKGILVGNGYRLTPPAAPERQNQFSTHVLNGAKKNEFCLLPTTELFKAVCAVLETPEDEGRKIEIRKSILSTVSVWTFARELSAAQDSAAAGESDR